MQFSNVPLRNLLLILAAIGVAALLLFALTHIGGVSGTPSGQSVALPPTPPSPEVAAYLAQSHGFQYLVSYTDRGFEPSTLTIKKGETVRFTNNAREDLWVAAKGDAEHAIYPGQSDCGASAFDTCKMLKRGDFWEFTFTKTGTWTYRNTADTARAGTVTVK